MRWHVSRLPGPLVDRLLIIEAKNSGDMEAGAGVPNACMVVEKALAVTKTVNASVEDTGSKELSKLFWYIKEA